jgi:capsular exopolysaccharide synthesis family protein
MNKHKAEQAAKAQATDAAAAQPDRAPASPPVADASAAAPAKPAGKPGQPSTGMHSAKRNSNGYSRLMVAYHEPGSSITEEYRALRIKLTAEHNDGKLCFLITSSDAGEGKTVTCANLAVVLAEREDRKTIIVDGDVRKGTLSSLFGQPREPGLANILKGAVTLRDTVCKTAFPNLFLLPAGKAGSHQFGELLIRPELEDLVNQLRREYDYVIFDSPPINTNTPDAGMIGRATGQAMLVVRMNKTRRESVEDAIRQLHGAKVEVGGLILTGRTFSIPRLLYGGPRGKYDYSYGYK